MVEGGRYIPPFNQAWPPNPKALTDLIWKPYRLLTPHKEGLFSPLDLQP